VFGAALGVAGGGGVCSGDEGIVAGGSVDGSLAGVSEPPHAKQNRAPKRIVVAIANRFMRAQVQTPCRASGFAFFAVFYATPTVCERGKIERPWPSCMAQPRDIRD
jgi:hypothetical protein